MSETLMTEAAAETAQTEAAQAATATVQPATEAEGTSTEATTEAEAATEKNAPESYDLKSPEGIEIDTDAFTAFAKDADLTQDQAQKLLEKMAPAMVARQQAAVEQARQQWVSDAKADKEFGGEKLSENLGVAKKAMDKFGSPELKALLEQSGLGNHPEVIRFFFRAGKAVSEDRVVTGSARGQAFDARSLYPNSNLK
jgi:hypothetical protein